LIVANADRIIDLLHEAKARPTGAEREQFLAEACQDDSALREQIVSLLEADAAEGESDFLKITRIIRQDIAPTEKPGDRIGRYKLLEQIGEGGCGVVYVAEQHEPVRRRVALKVIKLGMDTKQVIARFDAERQALAIMDHPNIAKVLDAGSTGTGRPYFVMELVRGIKITDYCDQHQLSPRDRLELFIQVCRAVQHAHQKGVMHRDIKPSNILVASDDGAPVPKVIDFGIAKATQGRLTDQTVYTAFEQFIGTPAYMSPEQAEMSLNEVDTRTDIYSLGVLLYELLTGKTPFDASELLKAGLDEMRRTIREQEPPKPSTRLSTMLEGELTSTARQRHTEAPRLIHLLRGDLDWIVMKCLEKDRTRRYETANGLAMDVKRHLANEPVGARPPSRLYRFERLVRRNKLAFAATSASTAALVAGLGLSTWLFLREREARQRAVAAEKSERALREEATVGEKLGAVELLCLQGNVENAQALFDSIPRATIDAHAARAIAVLQTLGAWHVGRQHWQSALSDYRLLIELNPNEHLNYHALSSVLAQVGDVEAYRQHCDKALLRFSGTKEPTIAERMAKDCLILPNTGMDLDAAGALADTAVTLGRSHPYLHNFQLAKGLAEYRQGHYASALDWMQKCFPAMDRQGPGGSWGAVEAHTVAAMANFQLRQTDAANRELAKGIQIAEKKASPINVSNLFKNNEMAWTDWIIAHALMREAGALIGVPSAVSGSQAK
jgi:serine/threonine protein kinase